MIYEFCAENVTLLEKRCRLELVESNLRPNLAVGVNNAKLGGATKAAVELAANYTPSTMTRPRGGDFVYTRNSDHARRHSFDCNRLEVSINFDKKVG